MNKIISQDEVNLAISKVASWRDKEVLKIERIVSESFLIFENLINNFSIDTFDCNSHNLRDDTQSVEYIFYFKDVKHSFNLIIYELKHSFTFSYTTTSSKGVYHKVDKKDLKIEELPELLVNFVKECYLKTESIRKEEIEIINKRQTSKQHKQILKQVNQALVGKNITQLEKILEFIKTM